MCNDSERPKDQEVLLRSMPAAYGNSIRSDGQSLGGLAPASQTPTVVRLLLDLYTSPAAARFLQYGERSPSDTLLIHRLLSAGLLTEGSDRYHIDREALRVYVDAVCRVGLPVKRWEVPT